ncbi:MAG: PAS domain S-box protein [Chloroflexi bacterium]|nr:PAS domain S-box protein [Chloroflexota bacterium]
MVEDKEIKLQLEDMFSDLEDPVMANEDVLVSLQGLIENVSERKQTQKQRMVFRALVENTPDAIFVSDLEGRQTYSNRACYDIFGYNYELGEMNGLSLANLWSEEDVSILVTQVFPQINTGGWSGKVRQKRRNNSFFDAHLTVFPVADKTGQPISIATIIRDISERADLEQERDAIREHYVSRTQLVTRLAQEIADAPTLNELFRRLVTRVKEHFGHYHVQLYRHNSGADVLTLVESYAQVSGEPELARHKLPCSTGIVGATVTTRKSVLVPNVSHDPRWWAHPDFPNTKGELAVPIQARAQELYVLDVLSDTAGALTHDDEMMLLDLCSRIASAIDNIRLIEEANVLRQFSQASEGISWITLEGNIIIYMNSTLSNMLGEVRPEATFGKPITSYYPKNLQERVQNEILPAVARQGRWVGELDFLSTRGQVIPTIQSMFLVRDENGTPLYLANVATDITQQKQVESLLDKRARQIGCLNDIGRKIEQTPQVSEFLSWVAQRISQAVQYQEISVAAIEFDGQVYGDIEALNLPYQLVESLYIDGEQMGLAAIAYTQKREFTGEEKSLLGDVVRQTSGYIESRRIFEQAQAVLDDVKATHQIFMPERWGELVPDQAPPDERPQQEIVAPSEDEPQTHQQSSPIGATLRKTWRRVSTGLFVVGVVFLLGILLTWTIKYQMRAERSTSVAFAQPFLSSPTPEGVAIASPSPTTDADLSDPKATPSPASQLAEAPLPAATLTSTPSPMPTPSPSPISLIVPSPFPTFEPGTQPEYSNSLPVPTPVQPVPVASDAINIVVMGSDQRPDWSEWHTDVVQVVSIQRDGGAVSVISIPRDLYLYIPGLWMSRINFADYYGDAYQYEGGGPALIRDTLLYNLGIRVDYFVRTNFDGLIEIVDTVGGVEIPVHCDLSDYWPYSDENGVYPILSMEPGLYHMDGETALWYARSRKTTSVFSRERRQQQVLQALWHKAQDTGMLIQVPALWSQGHDMIETDLTFTDIIDLARIALALKDQNVRFYNIGPNEVTPWTTPYGGAVFLPRWEEIQPLVAEAMAPVPEARMSRTYMPVEVWNGTPDKGWDHLAADRLYRAGFPAVIGESDQHDYSKTQLIIFSELVKGSGAGYLQQMFGISDEQMIYRPEGSTEFGFRLILGDDYQACPEL